MSVERCSNQEPYARPISICNKYHPLNNLNTQINIHCSSSDHLSSIDQTIPDVPESDDLNDSLSDNSNSFISIESRSAIDDTFDECDIFTFTSKVYIYAI